VSPRHSRSHCWTDASNDGLAFQPTRDGTGPMAPLRPSSRAASDPCVTCTPFGRPVEPDV
jgi:hypothetical protein